MAAPPLPVDFLREAVSNATLTRRANVAASLLLVYDFILTFDDEVQRIWKRTPWSGAKVLWFGHRYLNLANFLVIPMIMDSGVRCKLNNWFPFLETIIWQFFISAILGLRCWAIFRRSRVVLGVLVAVYLTCLGLQIYPTVMTFNLPLSRPPGVTSMGDRYTDCFLGSYMSIHLKGIDPWRIAGWVGSVAFDGVVTALTLFRAVRLRMSGLRIPLMETMLQDGIIYFAIVFGLNMALLITFSTIDCALKIMFQRMTQVLTVLVISRMVLNLKDSDPRAKEEAETYKTVVGSLLERSRFYQTSETHGAWVVGQKTKSSVVGNLGNDLRYTSVLDVEPSQ